MSTIRSARGTFVDFEMLAIKTQLAAKPVPKLVQERKLAIEEKEGIKPTPVEVNEMLEVSQAAAETAANTKAAPKRK